MNIFEAIGSFVVLFVFCVGLLTIGWLAVQGVYRVAGRIELNAAREETALREVLSDNPTSIEIRRQVNQ